MLLDPADWKLAQRSDELLPALDGDLAGHVSPETHGSALELFTGVHHDVGSAVAELRSLRSALEAKLAAAGLRGASAGTHPMAVWTDTVISGDERYRRVYQSMRELARREPTFALHVHVGVPDPEAGVELANRLRWQLPLLLALSVNSPFWQARDTGLCSARTPLFKAFPRVGIPRRFNDYRDYVETVDLLIRAGAFPDPSFIWSDVRLQPRFGTVEVRITDAQATVADTAAIVAVIQSLARMELGREATAIGAPDLPEVLDENRFLAARDGMAAELIDVRAERRLPAASLLGDLLEACASYGRELGCERELADAGRLCAATGAERQRAAFERTGGLEGVLEWLADQYTA